jgi:hypothetical protein
MLNLGLIIPSWRWIAIAIVLSIGVIHFDALWLAGRALQGGVLLSVAFGLYQRWSSSKQLPKTAA